MFSITFVDVYIHTYFILDNIDNTPKTLVIFCKTAYNSIKK